MLRPLLSAGILALLAAPTRPAGAPAGTAADTARSTRSGVYTTEQAELGKDVYALICVSCHTPVSHTGPAFIARWDRRPLWEMFDYIRTSMPKSEPGSLSEREYARVLSYILRMNGMPAGPTELAPDSTALQNIRIEFAATRDTTQPR
jgi:mono/diheme cytochrome c family protein